MQKQGVAVSSAQGILININVRENIANRSNRSKMSTDTFQTEMV